MDSIVTARVEVKIRLGSSRIVWVKHYQTDLMLFL